MYNNAHETHSGSPLTAQVPRQSRSPHTRLRRAVKDTHQRGSQGECFSKSSIQSDGGGGIHWERSGFDHRSNRKIRDEPLSAGGRDAHVIVDVYVHPRRAADGGTSGRERIGAAVRSVGKVLDGS